MADWRTRRGAFSNSWKKERDSCIGTSSNSWEDLAKISVDATMLLKPVHDTVNNNVHDCRPELSAVRVRVRHGVRRALAPAVAPIVVIVSNISGARRRAV